MATLTLWEIYFSPWSERVRWVLELKDLPYTRRPYRPIADEDELKRTTGIATAPVLLFDGRVVGDSDAAVDWAEQARPTPPLLPADPRQRAAVRALELAATEVLAPTGRLVMIGKWQAAGLQPLGDYFAAKYHWSPEAEARGGGRAVPGRGHVHTRRPDARLHAGAAPRRAAGRPLRARRPNALEVRRAHRRGTRRGAPADVARRDLPAAPRWSRRPRRGVENRGHEAAPPGAVRRP